MHRRDEGYKYIIGCNAGEKCRRLLERWWRSRIVRYVDKFHQVRFSGRKTTRWMCMDREETDKKTNDLQARHFCGHRCGKMCLMRRSEEKRKSGLSRNQSSMMPEDYVVFTSLIPRMKNSRILWKMRVESRKFRCLLQCLAEPDAMSTGKPASIPRIASSKYACIDEADDSTRKRLEGALHKSREDHIARMEINSLNHYYPVHNFIPMLQAMKKPDAKAAVDREWENLKRYRHGSWQKSETKKSDRWSKE